MYSGGFEKCWPKTRQNPLGLANYSLCILGPFQIKLKVGVTKPQKPKSERWLARNLEKPLGAESHALKRGKNNKVEKCKFHQAAKLKPFSACLRKIKPESRAPAKISAAGRAGPA